MFLFLLSFIITSCDAPVRTRVPSNTYLSDVGASGVDDNGVVANPDTNGGNGTITTGGTGISTGSENFPGCEYLSPQYNGGSIGYFGLCQGIDSRQFKAVLAESVPTCFVPVHILNSGNSFKLGMPQCLPNPTPDTQYPWTFVKEGVAPNFNMPRPEAINGVMVIRSTSVNAYMACMDAKENYFVVAQGCCAQTVYNSSTNKYNCVQPNPACEAAANAEANFRCGQFVQNHSDHYRQVDFR